jgi:hypothetical protein
MYGKIFTSMYEGTLHGQWEAMVTMQQLIVICDSDGVVDMTPTAIAGKTGIPLEIIEKGIKILEKPDPYSRTPDYEGRRIALLEDHRNWGWFLVNHKKYRDMIDAETRREQTRLRVTRHREKQKEAAQTDTPNLPTTKEPIKAVSDNLPAVVSPTKRFQKPTYDELLQFCKEKNFTHLNPEAFWNYYESNGWRVGKGQMKDWKAAATGWNSRDQREQRTKYERPSKLDEAIDSINRHRPV